jgi:hypothetical protein
VSALTLASIQHDSFELEPSLEAPDLCVRFSGTGDLDAIDALATFLPKVHAQALELSVREVKFDFRDLEFMNSSCFKAFVTFIDSARSSAASFRIRFITSSKHHWQRKSLEALRRLAMGLVTIQPDA